MGSRCVVGDNPLGFFSPVRWFSGGSGGASPGSKVSSAVKKSPVRWRS